MPPRPPRDYATNRVTLFASHRPPSPFIGVDPAIAVGVDPAPRGGGPIFLGAQEAIIVGVEGRPIMRPIIRVVVGAPIEAAGSPATLEFIAADTAILIGVPEPVGAGAEGIPLVATDDAVAVDVDIAIIAAYRGCFGSGRRSDRGRTAGGQGSRAC